MLGLNHWLLSGDMRWTLLLIPVALGLFFLRRHAGGYIRKVFTRSARDSAKTRLRGVLSPFFALLGLVVLVAALMGFTRGYAAVEERLTVNRFFVAIDNSSSMYNFDNDPGQIYCAKKNLREIYPRIFGACRALYRLIDETEAYAKRKGGTEKDRIALLRFALYSFAQVPLTSDYARLRRSVEEIDWHARSALGIYTEIHLALWDLYRQAFERNLRKESGLAYISFEDMRILANALAPEDKGKPFSLPFRFRDTVGENGALVAGLATRLKEEMRDTVFIFITDASTGQLEERIDKPPVSMRKMLEFATVLELPVYFVSTDEANNIYKRMARKTGFTLDGKDYHGDFFIANRDEGYVQLEALVSGILQVRFGRTILVRTDRRISYAAPLSFLVLTCFVLAVLFRETVSRSLTQV